MRHLVIGGAKSAMKDESFSEFVVDQLNEVGEVRCRHMFGGFGLYLRDTFFGLISSEGRLYFKTDSATREEYISRGMGPFRATSKLTLKSYYEVPPDVLEDPDVLAAWAKKAVECQRSESKKASSSKQTALKKKKSR